MHGEGSSQRKDKVFFLLEGVSHCKGFTVMLKQNVAERLFMEGPGQEKGTAVETAVLIAYAVFCAWGLVWMAAQATGGGGIPSGMRRGRKEGTFRL